MTAVSNSLCRAFGFDLKAKHEFYQTKDALLETIYSITTKRFSKETAETSLGDITMVNHRLNHLRTLSEKVSKVNESLYKCAYLDLATSESRQEKESSVIDRFGLVADKCPSEALYEALCSAKPKHLNKGLNYLKKPLEIIASVHSQRILGNNRVRLPKSTLIFFEKGIKGAFPKSHEKLGEGGNGAVKVATFVGSKFAYKTPISKAENKLKETVTEYAAYMLLKHPGITAIEAMDAGGIYLQLADGDLVDFFNNTSGWFSAQELKKYFQEIAKAVLHIHDLGLTYKDLKVDNVLFTRSGEDITLRLCDFAFVSPAKGDEVSSGTKEYAAPELHLGRAPYSQKVDTWAFGILMWMLIKSESPFQSPEEIVSRLNKSFAFNGSNALEAIAAKCLHGDPFKRPSMQQVANELEGFSY